MVYRKKVPMSQDGRVRHAKRKRRTKSWGTRLSVAIIVIVLGVTAYLSVNGL